MFCYLGIVEFCSGFYNFYIWLSFGWNPPINYIKQQVCLIFYVFFFFWPAMELICGQ